MRIIGSPRKRSAREDTAAPPARTSPTANPDPGRCKAR
jgi:hypothetical protein